MPLTQRGLPSYWGRRHREHLLAGKPEDQVQNVQKITTRLACEERR